MALGEAHSTQDSLDISGSEGIMLNVLVVEDEWLVAEAIASLLNVVPDVRVCGLACDFQGAKAMAEQGGLHVAFVDIELAHGSTGFEVAAMLTKLGVQCIFSTGRDFPQAFPELAVGCLTKPFGWTALMQALDAAQRDSYEEKVDPVDIPGWRCYRRTGTEHTVQ